VTFVDDFHGIFLILSLAGEREGIFGLAIGNLVNSVKKETMTIVKEASKAAHTGTIHLLPELTQGDVFPRPLYRSV